jgi:hypothetical protein
MKHTRRWIVLILLFHLALTLAYSVINPLGEAPDEADHWAYIVHLANERALPEGPRITQSKHPPFYHATAAAVASLGEPANDFMRANPDVQFQPAPGWSPNFFIHTTLEAWPWQGGTRAFHLVRLWSVLLSTLTVAAAYALARAAFPGMPWVAVAAAALLAGIPEFAFIGGSANNDNAAALFGTLALWGGLAIMRGDGRWRAGWWTPFALGLGLLSKTSTLGVWPAVGVAIVAGAVAAQAPTVTRPGPWLRAAVATWKRWVVTGLWVGIPALLIASPWFLRNWRLYGDPLGMDLALQTIDVRTTPWTWADSWWLLRGWFVSFWGKFGGAGHIPMAGWVYALLLGVSLLAVAGLVRILFTRHTPFRRDGAWVLLLAVVGVALVMWRYSLVALGTDQGRLLFPAIGAMVTLLAAGWLATVTAARQGTAASVIAGAAAVLGLYGLLGVIRPAFAPPAAAAVIAPATPVALGDMVLAGAALDREPVLYWRLTRQSGVDFRTVLRVVAQDGTLVWEWRRSPGAGRFSTDRWPVDYVMSDAYTINWPEWAGPGTYLVEVGVQPFGGDLIPPEGQEHPFLFVGEIERKGD